MHWSTKSSLGGCVYLVYQYLIWVQQMFGLIPQKATWWW